MNLNYFLSICQRNVPYFSIKLKSYSQTSSFLQKLSLFKDRLMGVLLISPLLKNFLHEQNKSIKIHF